MLYYRRIDIVIGRPVMTNGGVFELFKAVDYIPHTDTTSTSSNPIQSPSSSNSSNTNSNNAIQHRSFTDPHEPVTIAAVYCVAHTSQPHALAIEISKRIKSR